MATPEEKNLKKLTRLFAAMDEDSLTKEDFVTSFETVVKIINDLRASNEAEFEEIHQAVKLFSEKLKKDTASDTAELRKEVQRAVAEQLQAVEKKLKEADKRIASIQDGKKGDKGDSIEGKPGKDGSPDDGNAIIKKINKADSLIDPDAIQGFKELEKAVKEKTGNTTRIGWGAHPVTIQALGVTIDKGVRFINFTGSGLTSVSRGANGVVTVNIGGGSTLTPIVVTGTIDDSNVTFTAPSNPTFLVINAGVYQKTGSNITWTYLAGTITLSSPVGTGGSIYGL